VRLDAAPAAAPLPSAAHSAADAAEPAEAAEAAGVEGAPPAARAAGGARRRYASPAYELLLCNELRDADYRSFREVVLLARRQRAEGPKWRRVLQDRLRFAAGLARTLATIRVRRRRSARPRVLVEPSNEPRIVAGRRYYVSGQFGVDAEPVHWRDPIVISSRRDLRALVDALLLCVRCALTLDTSDVPLVPIWKFAMFRLAVRLSGATTVFVFDYTNIDIYLLVRSLGRERGIETYYAPSNSTLFDDARYGVYEGVRLVLCSKAQEEELHSLQTIGWLRLRKTEVIVGGNPFGYELRGLPRDIRYDVAFYSSGEWASRNGIWRVDDVAGISAGRYSGSIYDIVAREIIAALVRLARERGLRFAVHMHPYERQLWREHGLRPPWCSLLDGEHSLIAEWAAERHSNIYDARVGVVTLSSVLFDRLESGLPTLVYQPTARRPGQVFYRLEHIPSLAPFRFSDMAGLSEGVVRHLGEKIRSS
jgi:hypothetical protein